MPRLTTVFIRSSLVYLLLGFTFGGLLLLNKGAPVHPLLWRLLPAHIEFLLIGWTLQLVLGMGFWIFPRFKPPNTRGNVKLAWWAFILINLGILMIVLAAFASASSRVILAGRISETTGVILFILHAWPRIKGFGT